MIARHRLSFEGFQKNFDRGEQMRMSYQIVPRDQETQETARKIVDMLVDSGLTYEKASEALEEAQTLLGKTKPSCSPGPILPDG